MPSSSSNSDPENIFTFSASSPSSPSSIDSGGMSSEEDDESLLLSGGDVKVEVSVSDASDGSADLEGCETVVEEADWEDEAAVTAPIDGFLEGSADYSESLELGDGIVQDDGTEVCQETEGDSSDEYWDNVEEFVTGVAEETACVDEPTVSDSFLDFAEDRDLRESLGVVEELGGSERVERDHVPGNLVGDGSVAVRTSIAGDNSNMDEGFDYAERSGINGMEEGRSSGGSSGFEDDIDLEHDSPISVGASWDIVDRSRVVFNGDVIRRGFEELDWEVSLQPILDQIIRFHSGTRRRRDASSAAAKDVVESLPVTEVEEGMFEQGSGGCAVCKNNVQVGERVRRLPCLHFFHDECIMPWLEIRNTCPLCRHELPTEDVGRERFQLQQVDRVPFRGSDGRDSSLIFMSLVYIGQ